MNKQRKEGILHITIEKTKEADSTEELNEMCKFFLRILPINSLN